MALEGVRASGYGEKKNPLFWFILVQAKGRSEENEKFGSSQEDQGEETILTLSLSMFGLGKP